MPSANLQKISQIDEGGAELLIAVGIEGLASLSQSDPGSIFGEMEQANRHLELVEQVPSLDEVITWVEEARRIEGTEGPPVVTRLEAAVEVVPVEVLEAIQVTKESIVKNKISVADVPVMDDFCSKDDLFEERTVNHETNPPVNVEVREISTKSSEHSNVDESPRNERGEIQPLKSNRGFDIRKTVSPELNAGKKLHSRAYVRGVLHPQPTNVRIGAFFSIGTLVLLPTIFVVGFLYMTVFKDHVRDYLWLLAFPAAFLVFGFFYLILARPMKCRICGQPLFSPKKCRRNPKAHRVPILGYILPTSIHIFLFHWFRCIYCGTSVRVKK